MHSGALDSTVPFRDVPFMLSDQSAEAMAEAAAASAYELFCDEEFRRVAGVERLSQVEQDRVFNELVVTFLVLIMLLLEAPDLRVPPELRTYLAGLNKRISEAHVEHLKALGVEGDHLRDWEKLISMRYEEYARDRHEVRGAAMRIESAEKRLDLDGLSRIQLLVPVQVVAIGCHQHICRGNTDGRDDLFKQILESLSKFYVELRIRLERGKITPLMRARVALKRMIQRLGKKRPRRDSSNRL